MQSYAAKTRENPNWWAFYQPEALYTGALLAGFNKAIAEEITADLKNECMACYEPAV